MDLVKLAVTYDFLLPRFTLTWQDIRFGLSEELLDPRAVSRLAADRVTDSDAATSTLVQLAGLGDEDDPRSLVEDLAEPIGENQLAASKSLWLCIVLSWVFHKRDAYEDPLQFLDVIYADFGYPASIASFVRYMPSTDPDLGSRQANEARLFDRWAAFVEACSRRP
jgi:hypothetical protein